MEHGAGSSHGNEHFGTIRANGTLATLTNADVTLTLTLRVKNCDGRLAPFVQMLLNRTSAAREPAPQMKDTKIQSMPQRPSSKAPNPNPHAPSLTAPKAAEGPMAQRACTRAHTHTHTKPHPKPHVFKIQPRRKSHFTIHGISNSMKDTVGEFQLISRNNRPFATRVSQVRFFAGSLAVASGVIPTQESIDSLVVLRNRLEPSFLETERQQMHGV